MSVIQDVKSIFDALSSVDPNSVEVLGTTVEEGWRIPLQNGTLKIYAPRALSASPIDDFPMFSDAGAENLPDNFESAYEGEGIAARSGSVAGGTISRAYGQGSSSDPTSLPWLPIGDYESREAPAPLIPESASNFAVESSAHANNTPAPSVPQSSVGFPVVPPTYSLIEDAAIAFGPTASSNDAMDPYLSTLTRSQPPTTPYIPGPPVVQMPVSEHPGSTVYRNEADIGAIPFFPSSSSLANALNPTRTDADSTAATSPEQKRRRLG